MENHNRHNILLGALFLILFLIISIIDSRSIGIAIDSIGTDWSNKEHSPSLDMIYYGISKSSTILLLLSTGFFTLFFLLKKEWKDLIFYYFVIGGGVVFNVILKLIIQRPRPEGPQYYFQTDSFSLESYSFPSGHTMRTGILVLILIYFAFKYLRRLKDKALITATLSSYILLMGISRIYLKMHFITDIIGALMASLAWLFLCIYLYNLTLNKNKLS